MKIFFAYRAFADIAGGVQRIAALMMNEFVQRGHTVSLLTWDKEEHGSFYPLDPSIKWYKIGIGDHRVKADLKTKLCRMQKVREALREAQPDVILAFQDGPFQSMRAYSAGMGIPVVAAERNAPQRFDHTEAGKHRNLVYQGFRFARGLTVQCESFVTHYPSYLHDKMTVIPNPVFPAEVMAKPAGKKGAPKTLLSIGRFGYQKNLQVLVRAFAKIAADFPDWTLKIIGEGDDRPELEALAKSAGIADRVLMPGTTKDVPKEYLAAHLFCLPSRWEGFPNTLAEAMAHGLPAVGFGDCAGVADLIQDGETGLLAAGMNDENTLAEALSILMVDDKRRAEMGVAGTKFVQQFVPEKILDRWENYLEDMAA